MKPTRIDGQQTRERVLAAMPGTANQITSKTDVCYKTVAGCILELRKADRAHRGDWTVDVNGKPMAIYFAGAGIDAPKPEASVYVRKTAPVIVEPQPVRYDDTVMPRAFFGGRACE